jgi:glutamate dehydrogenase
MTDNVSELVLEDNRQQARCLTLDGLRSRARYEEFVDLIDRLVAARVFNREDEDAPTRDALLTSPTRDRGMPRPLLAVLLGHSKMLAYDETLASSFPESPDAHRFLHDYFPRLLQERFAAHFDKHPLRREIIATVAVNQVINQAGIGLLPRVAAATGASAGEIVAAYVAADAAKGGAAQRAELLASGTAVAEGQAALLALEDEIEQVVRQALGTQSRPSSREKRS